MVGLLAFVNPFIVLADAGVSIPFKYNQFYIPMFFFLFPYTFPHCSFHALALFSVCVKSNVSGFEN